MLGRNALKLLARTLLMAALLSSASAFAQPAGTSVQAVGDACPPIDASLAKDFAPFMEAMLTPGRVMNVAEMLKNMSPEMMAKMAAMQKAGMERQAKDWPNLCRYAAENAAVCFSP